LNLKALAERALAYSPAWLAISAFFIVTASSPARAGCTVDITGTIVTCTGDVSGGVSYDHTHSNGITVTTLDVNSLTTNIAPPSGTPGLSLTWKGVNGSNGSGGDPPGSAGHPGPGEDLTLNYLQPGASVSISASGAIVTTNATGVIVRSEGGDGGDGGDSSGSTDGRGGTAGGIGGVVTVTISGAISSSGTSLPAVLVQSLGGDGGNGGDSNSGSPGNGGAGGAGGNVSVTVSGTIAATGDESGGIVAISRGGGAGSHGGCTGASCDNTHSGLSAPGGDVSVTTTAGTAITTDGSYANGIFATSVGGFGAAGISKTGIVVYGSNGKSGGPGGMVTVDNAANITTYQEGSYGIFAQSIGGGGGAGGKSGGLDSVGGHGGGGGAGGVVNVTNSGILTTNGDNSLGIFAQSVGGTGGDGGKSTGFSSIGGAGSDTSDGAAVMVGNTGAISTQGSFSQGIFAQSIGGGGGKGGRSTGPISIGGSGGGGGDGGTVTVTNSGLITTVGDNAQAILVQSVGGGGGNGGSSSGSLTVGGSGGTGGNGHGATLTNNGNVATQGADANAIMVQSVGGGGGNGGSSTASGPSVAISMGGAGGAAGDAGAAQLLRDGSNTAYSVVTQGDRSAGVFVQSVGGGGGNGGVSIAASVGVSFAATSAMGGKGGAGGDGTSVLVQTAGTITTGGANADGIFAQSIGGGGGNGGFAVNASGSLGFSAVVGLGGVGGGGGNAGSVTVSNLSSIITTGERSNGLVAQSVGGGGGNGGYAVAAGAAGNFAASVAFGGDGGTGGHSGSVQVDSTGSIATSGAMANAIFAQSVGGGGGNGGFSVSGAVAALGGAVGLSFGGDAGGGNDAGTVTVNSTGVITTHGANAVGIFVQSVGGGGGNGGFAATGTFGGLGALSLSFGGTGGTGGNANTVQLTSHGTIMTDGANAVAIQAQSIGGGGGNGGFALSAAAGNAGASLAFGGSGSGGGIGRDVTVDNTGTIQTLGARAIGILAQSIGGGGGNGGFAVSGALGAGAAVTSGFGGTGGTGNTAGIVTVTNAGSITTSGAMASGIFAQSVGGGGGNGGFAGSGSFSANGAAGLSLGGSGGTGGTASTVQVTSTGNITTSGGQAVAIQAQSIGGGGGNGGFALGASGGSTGVIATVGGDAGAGGIGGNVVIDITGAIHTSGAHSNGLLAQSIGGGGGNGGFSVAGAFSTGAGAAALSFGGSGGSGNTAGTVTTTVNATTTIVTEGNGSVGIFAQSVGGGGGNGGFAASGALTTGTALSLSFGGGGGTGGDASTVQVTSHGNVTSLGSNSAGILAQSIGGGGGNGGFSLSASVGSGSAALSFGGGAGTGGVGSNVILGNTGTIQTTGALSDGILAQSIGGGGGNGGFSVAGAFSAGLAPTVTLGGAGGAGNTSGTVTLTNNGAISTQGDGSVGIFAQSVGGGGGNGGFAASGSISIGIPIALALGGSGGTGASANTVDVTNTNTIVTLGRNATGILAQSIGGGGGNGGFALSGSVGVISGAVSIGGSGGAGSNGGAVIVDNSGAISTAGAQAYGIMAQSVGGGGGNGGFALAGTIGVQVDDVPGIAAAVSIGGKGGGASNGSTVTVNSSGNIETSGLGAYAIFAQSVGGGGGSGGFAGSVAMTVGSGAAFSAAIGGAGSGGGNAAAVQVTTTGGTIITHNDGASGILAQSVGGGGGDGGFAFSGAFGFGGEKNINMSVAIGGAGGGGGLGSAVTVDNQAAISTFGTRSYGIFAQSVGGGGGNGGMAVSGTLGLSESSGNVGVSIGGGGGTGNTASTVTVSNSAAISTAGMESVGIFAQSVGGSGGNGGMALTAQLTGTSKLTATIGVAIGGGGGTGNSAGEVDVTNQSGGSIITSGFGAHGIFAQSVGGGGGNGGMAIAAQLGLPSGIAAATKTLNVGVAVGGAGGDGGFGNIVHVINHGTVNVSGDSATGVFAQSIGGGGGNGGGAVSALGLIVDSTNTSQRSLNINAAIGGGGGNGNHGGVVTVDNSGAITTHGASGYGVFAQSVGGGGGIGGNANTLSLVVTDACTLCSNGPSFSNFFTLGATVGGNGGGASNGRAVTVNNTGRIETFGDTSDGIYAQSVGGGGGNGGNGTIGLTGVLPDQVGLLATFVGASAGAVSFYKNLQVVVGGNNGSSGNGGTVSVDNDKNITTHGSNSNAITAQSVGGGGGIAGKAAIGLTGTLGIGGKGGAGGNGGDVTVNQHGGATIETFGTASYGVFAQSVGGGGGVAGNVDRMLASVGVNLGIGLAFGQGGGAGGNGGAVNVSADGTILTHGNNAVGIWAQSVGGGGGALGELGNGGVLSFQVGSAGDDGNAGAVNVTLNGAIATSGNNATGIFAQSAAGVGTAGDVTVTLNSSVVTGAILGAQDGTANAPLRGLGSVGILAQSTVASTGTLCGAIPFVVSCPAVANNGNITINLNNAGGIVQGGRTDVANGYLGVGIWLIDGKNNTINNHGLVTTISGVDGGYAILATGSDPTPQLFGNPAVQPGGNETVNNFGTIIGSVDLGAGINAFNNNIGALFSPGTVAYVGAGNTLTNNGTISPGGSSKAMTTALTGNFVQSSTGRYTTSLDFLPNIADRIDVSGTTAIAGLAAVNPVNQGNAKPGNYQYTILSSGGGTNHAGLTLSAPVSAVASYQLLYPNANDIVLSYGVNFQPAGLPTNLSSIGNAINNIQTAGTNPGFSPIAAALFNLPNLQSLTQAYNALGGSGTAGAQQSSFGAGQLFTSSVLDQAALWLNGGNDANGVTFVEESGGALQYAATRKRVSEAFAQFNPAQSSGPDRWRAWMAGFGGRQTVGGDASVNSAGLYQSTFGGGFGIDRQINKDFLLGIALGASRSNFSVAERATDGSLDGGHVALYGMMRRGAWYTAASLAYAHFDNETNRTISGVGPSERATGKFASNQLSGKLEIGRRSDFGRFAVTPFTAIEFGQLWQQGYSETSRLVVGGGPGVLGLTYGAQATTSVQSSIGVQVNSRFELSGEMVLSPFVRVAWVHEFQPAREVTPSLNVAPGFSFSSSGVSAASDLTRVNAGANLRVGAHESIFAAVSGDFGSNTRSYGVTGGYRIGW